MLGPITQKRKYLKAVGGVSTSAITMSHFVMYAAGDTNKTSECLLRNLLVLILQKHRHLFYVRWSAQKKSELGIKLEVIV
jgi:cyanophycinase-like exopeptidase